MINDLMELNVGGDEMKEFADILGTGDSSPSDMMPIVKIVTSEEDAQGRPLTRGQLYLKSNDIEPVYTDSMKIRPLSNVYQYNHFDSMKNESVCRTIQSPSWNVEFRDTKGTLKCGRPDDWYDRPDDEKASWKDIKCNRILRVLVSYEGKDADGNSLKVENKPAIIFNKSSNFNQFNDQYLKILPRNKRLYDYWCDVTTAKQKKGGVSYFTMEYKPDFKNPVPLDEKTLETLRVIVNIIKNANAFVNKAYVDQIQQNSITDNATDMIEDAEKLSELEKDLV
jgi:hypothetical protein